MRRVHDGLLKIANTANNLTVKLFTYSPPLSFTMCSNAIRMLFMAALKHEVLLRLRAIELIAYWEGRLITTQLMEWFGITRQQASSDINRYNTKFNPDALVHSAALKGYVPAAGFRPALTSGHINEYMGLENLSHWFGTLAGDETHVFVDMTRSKCRPEPCGWHVAFEGCAMNQ